VAHPQIAAFPRLAEANAQPTRSIAGQNTLITRTIHDMSYDPVRDEIVVPQFYAQAIMTYRGDADGDVPPIRIIRGPSTQIQNPDRSTLDPIHNEIFVPQHDRILVFPRDGQGDVAPIRVIEGPEVLADAIAVDPVSNLLIVTSAAARNPDGSRAGQVSMFNRTDNGTVKPLRVIRGPRTGMERAQLIAAYPPRGLFLVGAPSIRNTALNNFVGVWSIHDNGDVPPRWTIGGPNGVLRQIRGITLDPEHKNVIVSDKYLNAILTFNFPEIF
jgi:hypothetical protein